MKIKPNQIHLSTRPIAWGFTLVELLLVLTILTLLAAIVYPRISQHAVRARVSATVTQIASIGTALQMFEVDTGSLPKGKAGLNELIEKPRDAQNWNGPYLEGIPKDPWQNDYIYTYPGKYHPNGFDLISMGPDGQLGTVDDIMNLQLARK